MTITAGHRQAAGPPQGARAEYDLGGIDRIPPGEGRRFVVEGLEIAVFRTRGGDVYATQADCPHRAGPLEDGVVGGATLLCPLHGYGFDLATGRSADGGCPALATYPVRVESGRLKLAVPQPGQRGAQEAGR